MSELVGRLAPIEPPMVAAAAAAGVKKKGAGSRTKSPTKLTQGRTLSLRKSPQKTTTAAGGHGSLASPPATGAVRRGPSRGASRSSMRAAEAEGGGDPRSRRCPGGRPASPARLGPRSASHLSVRSGRSGYSIASRRSIAVYAKAAKVILPGLSWMWAFSVALLMSASSLAGQALISEHWVVGDTASPTRGTVEVGPLRRCFTPEYQDSLCLNLAPLDSPNSSWKAGSIVLLTGIMLLALSIFLTAIAVAIPVVARYAMYTTMLSTLCVVATLVLIADGYSELADSCPDGTTLYAHCGLTCHGDGSTGWLICAPFSIGWAFEYTIAATALGVMACGALHGTDKSPPVPLPKTKSTRGVSRGPSRQSLRSPGSPRPGTQALRLASLRPPGHLGPEPSASPGTRQQPLPGRGRGRGELSGPADDDADFEWQSGAGGGAPSAVSTVVEDTEDDEEPTLYVEDTADLETPSRKNRLSARASTSI